MTEINKKDRLPVWANSWLQVAQKLMHQDYYDTQIGGPDEPVMIVPTKDIQIFSKVTDEVGVTEFFQGDAPTVKMRAFDEIFEILPKEDETHKLITHLEMMMYQSPTFYENGEHHPLLKFLKQLSNLYHER